MTVLTYVLVDVLFRRYFMDPSFTRYQLMYRLITFSEALNPPQFSALFV